MDNKEIKRLFDYLINSSRFWHLEYAKKTLIPSEYNKIVKECDKFDNLLRKRVDNLINNNYKGKPTDIDNYNQIFSKDVLMIKEIKIYTDVDCITISKEDYTKEELDNTIKLLKDGEDIELNSFYKNLFLSSSIIKGYEVEYTSSYEDAIKKGGI
ncbi:hypothetical protein TwortDSMZ_046 [Staphylococcus phage Twort]|uniref:Uncharacterized protein n=2 Tax=Staphylococcus phage Twort (strain DSM 17442 / HER 48) TaxID=2908167 RepID=A0A6H0X5C6_BPTWO|nr:hypothetical protein TwortORF080 [Staphylococcus phage Twort]AAX92374.1 ORF080 [Staphylococcus phage Twort]QIW89052.1 hypothetical protein TwortDSMZ_046 [Staphylococcus phage Twort]